MPESNPQSQPDRPGRPPLPWTEPRVTVDGIIGQVDAQRIRQRRFTVVLDCGNGASVTTSPQLLRRLGTDTECGDTLVWLSESRNKKCVTIDLQTERGRELLKRLAAKCDVVVTQVTSGRGRDCASSATERRTCGPQSIEDYRHVDCFLNEGAGILGLFRLFAIQVDVLTFIAQCVQPHR